MSLVLATHSSTSSSLLVEPDTLDEIYLSFFTRVVCLLKIAPISVPPLFPRCRAATGAIGPPVSPRGARYSAANYSAANGDHATTSLCFLGAFLADRRSTPHPNEHELPTLTSNNSYRIQHKCTPPSGPAKKGPCSPCNDVASAG
jgi:hypothetical protein